MTRKPKVVVKYLPPGEAEGARDLRKWAGRQLLGRSGLRDKDKKKERKSALELKADAILARGR